MSLRDRVVAKQGYDQMMARWDDESRGISGGSTWPIYESKCGAKIGGDQEGIHWACYICVAMFCVVCSICVLCVLDVLGLIK